MISKKNKAMTAGVLAAAMTATSMIPAFASAANEYATENGANESYAAMFESLYDDVITNGQTNGYLSKQTNGKGSFGIPYHSRETLCVEAPDYGHETTSEAMSYIAWVTAMHDVLVQNKKISGSVGDLEKGWKTLEAIIPGWSNAAPEKWDYASIWEQEKLKADTATEEKDPSLYPSKQNNVDALNPIYDDLKKTYGGDEGYYLMHWLADVDDWYGFGGGTPGAGTGKFTFINTFQRGEQESCFETVPQPCLEDLKFGMESNSTSQGNGIKAIFNGLDSVPMQYAFTNAPDAEDRAIQAIYFASQWGVDCGEMSYLAGKMGDQCRNDMFDKYYKEIGCWKKQGIDTASSGLKSQHYLMSWYTSWGGCGPVKEYTPYSWAWQIGCSHSHQFYQNPLAAYALAYDENIGDESNKSKNYKKDYEESLKRQIEMYLWLQSADGPFAGGCTNSPGGQYKESDVEKPGSEFYEMAYVEHPVYADPGSNHWIGNQVWSTQRLAELYFYVKTKGDLSKQTYGGLSLEEALDTLLERWITWFIDNTKLDGYVADDGTEMAYAIPSNLDWSGAPAAWKGTYDANANKGLTCTITGYGQGDIGCVSSFCNTLIYYAAANKVAASAASDPNGKSLPEKALYVANKLMSAQWNLGRDEVGIAFEDHNGSLVRMFEQEVYIPKYYKGTMPDGSKLEPGATFSSIREIYASDPMYKECKAVYDKTGGTDEYTYKLHRFWHMGDALMTTGTMALLFPEVKPFDEDGNGGGNGGNDTKPTDPGNNTGDIMWGDANCDGEVTMADATAILQYVGNKDKYNLSAQGLKNADVVDNPKGVTAMDSLAVQAYDAKILKQSDWPMTQDELMAKTKS